MFDQQAPFKSVPGLFDNVFGKTKLGSDGLVSGGEIKSTTNFITKKKANKKKKKGFSDIGSLLKKYTLDDKGGYITKEFQDFGFRLAVTLNDLKHKSLYIKMAKTMDRGVLERALSFVSDAHSAKSKAKLFMWKVKQLRKENAKKN